MKSLSKLLAEYLDLRRKLGFKAEREAWLLRSLVSFLRTKGSAFVTTDLALAWAKRSADTHPSWWASKLSVARGFAKHIHVIDARHQVPPCDLLPRYCRRSTPTIYSADEITRLLRAAHEMSSRTTQGLLFRRATYETFFGLVAVTGMRVGEAIHLDCSDVDWVNRLVIVRDSKFGKSREIVLDDTVVRALRHYANERDCTHPRPRSAMHSGWVTSPSTRPRSICTPTSRPKNVPSPRPRHRTRAKRGIAQPTLSWASYRHSNYAASGTRRAHSECGRTRARGIKSNAA